MLVQLTLVSPDKSRRGPDACFSKRTILIGRGEDCDIRPACREVSREHCQIHVGEKQVILEDLLSSNGTFLDGEQLSEPKPLSDGNVIGVGTLHLEVGIFPDVETQVPPVKGRILSWDDATVYDELDVQPSSKTHLGLDDDEDAHNTILTKLIGETIEQYMGEHQEVTPGQVKGVLRELLDALDTPLGEHGESAEVPAIVTETWPLLPEEMRHTIVMMVQRFSESR